MKMLFLTILLVLAFAACGGDEYCRPVGPGHQNKPPSIQAQGDTSIVLGDTLRLKASATDPDGDEITFHLTVFLRGTWEQDYVADAFLDPQTGDFWFVPGGADLPDRSMMFTAADEHGYTASTQFNVTSSYYLDQVNDWFNPTLARNVIYYSPIGQEFVPDLSALDIVQLWLDCSSDTSRFLINIRSATITGPIAGTSEVLTLLGRVDDVATFEFERVALTPGEVYVIELVQVSGWNGMVRSLGEGSTYPHGRYIMSGQPNERDDFWFRLGAIAPHPGGSAAGNNMSTRIPPRR